MLAYDKNTLSEYLERLAAREPVPGGGSAAALSASMGAALMAMATHYSLGKGKPKPVEAKLEKIVAAADQAREGFLNTVTLDSQAYLNIVAARKAKDAQAVKQANREASKLSKDFIKSCSALLKHIPFLKKEGNPYLISDVVASEIFLNAAISAAKAMVEANQ